MKHNHPSPTSIQSFRVRLGLPLPLHDASFVYNAEDPCDKSKRELIQLTNWSERLNFLFLCGIKPLVLYFCFFSAHLFKNRRFLLISKVVYRLLISTSNIQAGLYTIWGIFVEVCCLASPGESAWLWQFSWSMSLVTYKCNLSLFTP